MAQLGRTTCPGRIPEKILYKKVLEVSDLTNGLMRVLIGTEIYNQVITLLVKQTRTLFEIIHLCPVTYSSTK